MQLSPELQERLKNLSIEDLERLTAISREDLRQSILDSGIGEENKEADPAMDRLRCRRPTVMAEFVTK